MQPNPLALYAATLLAAGVLTARGLPGGKSNWETIAVAAALGSGVLCLTQSRSRLDVFGILSWVVAAAPLCLLARARMQPRGAVTLVLVLALAHQAGVFIAGNAWDPAALPLPRRILGPGDAYSFCETRDHRHIYAVVPACVGRNYDRCLQGTILEYDASTLALTRQFHPFDAGFSGRMLHVVCLDDSLLVGMSFTRLSGTKRDENVMEVSMEDGRVLNADVVGPRAGHRILRHPDGSAAFVASEYSNVILRQPLQLVAGSTTRQRPSATRIDIGESRSQAFFNPFWGSLQTEVDAVRPAPGSGFFAEWIGGHRVHEVELDTGRVLRSYPVNEGGTHSMAVDRELNRLVVTGLWGVDLIDLATGHVIARRRTDIGPRLPIIDARHGVIFVAPTFGPQVWILDRRTLSVVGKLPVGFGARNMLMTSDGRWLLVGGRGRQVAWDLDAFAPPSA
jgi:hypothetical protein